MSIGVVAALGVVGLAVVAIRRFGRPDDPWAERRDGEVAPMGLALAAGIFILIAVIGGAGGFVAILGFTQVRAWGRASVFVAMIGLTAALVFVDRFNGIRHTRPVVAALLTLSVGLIGVVDQTATADFEPIGPVEAELAAQQAFVHDMEAALPADTAVLQLPLLDFPESPSPGAMHDYDQIRPFILGDGSLRWSAGGMKGREADWQRWWAGQPIAVQISAAVRAGFGALYVDFDGYPDPVAARTEITGVLGEPDGVDAVGNLAWYRLRPERPPSPDVVRPIVVVPISGVSDTDWTRARWMTAPVAVYQVHSVSGGGPVIVRITATGPPSRLTASMGDASSSVELDGTPRTIELTVDSFSTDGTLELRTDLEPPPESSIDRRVKLTSIVGVDRAAFETVLGSASTRG